MRLEDCEVALGVAGSTGVHSLTRLYPVALEEGKVRRALGVVGSTGGR